MSRAAVHGLALAIAFILVILSAVFVDHVKKFAAILSIAGACSALCVAVMTLYMDINPPPEDESIWFKSALADWGGFLSGLAVVLAVVILGRLT